MEQGLCYPAESRPIDGDLREQRPRETRFRRWADRKKTRQGRGTNAVIYLALMVIVAVIGIGSLWIHQRRQQAHLDSVEGFNEALKAISPGGAPGPAEQAQRAARRPSPGRAQSRAQGRPVPLDAGQRAGARRRVEERRRMEARRRTQIARAAAPRSDS